MASFTDYLMVITPAPEVMMQIERYKQATIRSIGHFEGMYSPGHIIISRQNRCMSCLAVNAFEEMQNRMMTMAPGILNISGFDYSINAFNGVTVYAVIKQNPKTKYWFNVLKANMRFKIDNTNPKIIIAENIPVSAFQKLWPKIQEKPLNISFTANSLTILQRDTYVEYCEWKIYRELFFKNRQKEIF